MSYPREYVCPRCRRVYNANWEWVCGFCETDEFLEALVDILIHLEPMVRTSICPADGCLVAAGEACPACILRRQQTAQAMTARPAMGTALPPLGWIRQGPILVRKKAA